MEKDKNEKFTYDFSIVIPIFNAEKSIEKTISSILGLSYEASKIQVILVNDGSTDGTLKKLNAIIENKKSLNFILIDQENSGVSFARNSGIKKSEGKYILFLDADDTISPETLKSIFDFFEENYEEIDIVTYDLIYENSAKKHYRSNLIKESQILNSDNAQCITLTTINVCIKNRREKNIFFNTSLQVHEDEEFSARVVMDKKKFGYVKNACYIYDNSIDFSATSTKLHPFYSFDSSISMYEKLTIDFQENGKTPVYIQNLIVNDLSWKLRSNVLFVQGGKSYFSHLNAVKKILEGIDGSIILNHPNVDNYHKHYFLSLKKNKPSITMEGEKIIFNINNKKIHVKDNNIYFYEFKRTDDKRVLISGIFKNYITNYVSPDEFKLYAIFDGEAKLIETKDSYFGCHRSKIKTNNFLSFEISLSLDGNAGKDLRMYVSFRGCFYQIRNLYFSDNCFLSPLNKGRRYAFYDGQGLVFDFEKKSFKIFSGFDFYKNYLKDCNALLHKNYKKLLMTIAVNLPLKKRIWIYIDKNNVIDNSFFQFLNDHLKKDGVSRYYVYHSNEDKTKILNHGVDEKFLIKFRSFRHKYLFFRSQIVFTSFADESFYLPASPANYHLNYSNKFSPKIVYLQHGVLHAISNNYAREFKSFDFIVVSTNSEFDLYLKFGYKKNQLLKLGMPRFDYLKKGNIQQAKIQRILYLPSWRSYLAKKDSKNNWEVVEKKLLVSNFFKGLSDVFNDKELIDLLKNENIELNVSLHPIFKGIENLIAGNKFVSFVSEYSISDYDLIITDFSSVVYDAVYAGKFVAYFCPDELEISEGLNLYIDTATPMNDGFGLFANNVNKLVDNLKFYIHKQEIIIDLYSMKYKKCFFEFSESSKSIYNFFLKKEINHD